jgi:hypothetical protein
MKFNDRKEWHYDQSVFSSSDVQIALKIHAEYIEKHSPRPFPLFLEVDRSSLNMDDLWHIPLGQRTAFSRQISMPILLLKERPDWRLTKVGLTPQQKFKVWLANLHLQKNDWFPARGDMLVYEGYRHMIINVVLEPNSYWQQTNVWLGLICETVIPADGDAKPLVNPEAIALSEHTHPAFPLPEI